jgi:5-formyltetrahydrofolate cyclo-ligase
MGEDQERTKHQLRREVSSARRGLDAGVAVRLDSQIYSRVANLPCFAQLRHVVAYAPIGREVDPGPLVRDALAAGAAVYYPKARGQEMEFLAADPERLVLGPQGVLEPAGGAALGAGTPDVVILVPGVAFDPRGVRLGRGLGCYDRALARHSTAFRIGLAYELQIVAAAPESAWDERMDIVATEARLITGERRPGRAVKEMSSWN